MALLDLRVDLDSNTEIWRYLRLNVFLELLTGRLTFTRADLFDDKNEGGYGYKEAVVRDAVFGYLGLSRNRSVHFDPNLDTVVPRLAHEAIYPARRRAYLNCWMFQVNESYAMWNVYGRPHESVAIVSTVGKLASAIRSGLWDLDVEGRIGVVSYSKPVVPIDHISDFFFHKRPQFEFEHEVRAVMTSQAESEYAFYSMPMRDEKDPNILGMSRPQLEQLLSTVVVAPGSRLSFREAVEAALTRVTQNPLLIPVRHSSLDEDIVPEPMDPSPNAQSRFVNGT